MELMKVSFFNLERQYRDLQPEMEQQVLETLRACAFIEGPAVKTLEASLAEYLRVKHAITCGNGTDALKLALRACRVLPGDEVITSPFTFFASAEAIAAVGAVPVFVDIDPVTLNLDPSRIEAAITAKTSAILPVDIFGVPAEMDAINEIAKHHGLRVIEDACQAIGAEYRGKKAGALSDAGCFSFYPTKNLAAYGDGGMITTDDDDIALLCRAYKAHGNGKNGAKAARLLGMDADDPEQNVQGKSDGLYDPYKYYNYLVGDNSRLDTVQAAVLRVKLGHLDRYNEQRTENARRYHEGLQGLPLRLPPLTLPGIRQCWHQYALMSQEKTALIDHLGAAQIGTGAFYPVPLHLQKVFRPLGYREGDLPNAEQACRQSVCLPVYPELTAEESDYVIQTIRAFYRKG
ncbi:MAG TPA: DegT/DnrJ/EryC1/StrS family aminotransferase [Candidatus Limiplasma sp.]|nr:DegT/DnrJ/EryC1/StrS family aminotransferase [Candidatus Limiplasma sp.]HPS80322.1 DegT/DnrJ/EryC1/StrS family aminotransferase [Candidatus Limiplasma sp.]